MANFSKSPRNGATATKGSSLASDWTFCEYYIPGQPLVTSAEPARRGIFARWKPRNP